MDESHMGHLSRFRFTFSRSRIASSNDREMDVIVDINVFYSDLQARWIPADVTSGKFKIAHHCITSSYRKCNSRLSYHRRLLAESGRNARSCWGSSALRALPSKTEMCSNFETSADAPAEWASFSVQESLYMLNIMTGTFGITRFRTRVASRPFITGIERSSRIKSGCNSRALSTASLPFSASPQTLKSSSRSKILHKACRMNILSSAISTV